MATRQVRIFTRTEASGAVTALSEDEKADGADWSAEVWAGVTFTESSHLVEVDVPQPSALVTESDGEPSASAAAAE